MICRPLDKTPSMDVSEAEKGNHGEAKNYDEPESYRKIKQTECVRNAR